MAAAPTTRTGKPVEENITRAALTFFSYSVGKQMSVIFNYRVHNSNPLHFLGRCSLNMMCAKTGFQYIS